MPGPGFRLFGQTKPRLTLLIADDVTAGLSIRIISEVQGAILYVQITVSQKLHNWKALRRRIMKQNIVEKKNKISSGQRNGIFVSGQISHLISI